MQARFRPPPELDQAALTRSYYADLQGFSEGVLRKAYDRVRQAKPSRIYWPFPEEFMAAAREVKAEEPVGGGTPRETESDRQKRVHALRERVMWSSLGQLAATEGWAWDLWLFLGREIREPTQPEQTRMKASATKAEQAYIGLKNNPEGHLFSAVLVTLYEAIEHKAARIAAKYRRAA